MNQRFGLPAEIALQVDGVILSTGVTPADILAANDEALVQLQVQLGLGNTWGLWDVPVNWLPPKLAQVPSTRTYRLSLALPHGVKEESEQGLRIWREILRVAIALTMFPGKTGRRLKPSTILNRLFQLGKLARHVSSIPGSGFWGRVTKEQAIAVLGDNSPQHALCTSLVYLHTLGAIADAPGGRPKPIGQEGPRDRTGEDESDNAPKEDRKWQPYPDDYTASAGWHALMMIKLVGPTLLDALEEATAIEVRSTNTDKRSVGFSAPLKPGSQWLVRSEALDPIIAGWAWKAPDGTPLQSLPFHIDLAYAGGRKVAWPPNTLGEAWALLGLLQSCHLWPVTLALPQRHGEILFMHEACVASDRRQIDRAAYKTWKLDGVTGRETDGPLPPVVVSALCQQERLAKLIKRVFGKGGNHLWVQVRTGKELPSCQKALKTFNRAFGLEPLLQGTSAHLHRSRKTLVRIVALALVHAPKILMDVLCHKDEQVTVMRYILSDPALLSEIQKVVRELIVLKGVEAVKNRDHLQGAAAPLLRERVEAYTKRLGARAMEPQNLLEFVRAMTENGSAWAIVAEGIVCTGFKTGGLCNEGQGGEANPHYCNPACPKQLIFSDREEGARVVSAIVETIRTVEYALNALQEAEQVDDVMLVAQFKGQVSTWLNRWREVDQHFSASPLLKKHFPNLVLLS